MFIANFLVVVEVAFNSLRNFVAKTKIMMRLDNQEVSETQVAAAVRRTIVLHEQS